jgi:hypothetical protein
MVEDAIETTCKEQTLDQRIDEMFYSIKRRDKAQARRDRITKIALIAVAAVAAVKIVGNQKTDTTEQ